VVRDIFATLRRLNQMGVSILLAEQNTRMALRTASYGYVISGGLIVQKADAQTLAAEPVVQNAYLGL
jgi:branched-chain amino acid transport system ATP-binding protein